ncbi:MAG TPA: hypothetical protein VFX17_03390 [Patescibacteria group bacterium]|nr:hypothetical protein [Patescibacteria group bacterium]
MNREDIDPKEMERLTNPEAKLLFLLKYASIAPSSHNTQPWRLRINSNTIEIKPEFKRRLVYSDSKDRQLYLSLGTCIENLLLASKAYGFTFDLQIKNDESSVYALISYSNLQLNLIDYTTLESIIARASNRELFEDRPVPDEFVEKLKLIAGSKAEISFVTDQAQRTKIIDVVGTSIQDAFLDKQFTNELSGWIKPSLKKYQLGMPGYNVGIPWPLSFVMPWVIGHVKMDKTQRKMDEAPLRAAPMFVLLSNDSDEPTSWIQVGQVFEEIAVEADKIGLKIGIQGAPIEIGDHYKTLGQLFGAKGRPMIFFRIGFTSKNKPKSPRLLVNQLIEQ